MTQAIRRVGGAVLLAVILGTTPAGCDRQPAKTKAEKLVEVVVARPVLREIAEFEIFTGRTEAVYTVDLRSRVTGYLKKALFTEGRDVEAGTLLFQIDPETYEAEVERAQAALSQQEAHVSRLLGDFRRARMLLPGRAVSVEEVEKISGDRLEAESTVQAAKAALRSAKLNLEFTRITAPISGRISRRQCDPGNLVKADDTILTTLVSLDPIHAYFDIDERTVLKMRAQGKLLTTEESHLPVRLGLASEEGYPISGEIDFIDNRLDPGTGTLRIRTRIDNPKKVLAPGMFIRLQLPVNPPEKCVMAPEVALGTDQGKKFLYVLNDKDEVTQRQVEVGQLQNGWRVIKKGLSAGERVVVTGQQRIRLPRNPDGSVQSIKVQPIERQEGK